MAMTIKTTPELWGEDALRLIEESEAMANCRLLNLRKLNVRLSPLCGRALKILYFLPRKIKNDGKIHPR